jgi:hypothetical protein
VLVCQAELLRLERPILRLDDTLDGLFGSKEKEQSKYYTIDAKAFERMFLEVMDKPFDYYIWRKEGSNETNGQKQRVLHIGENHMSHLNEIE